MDTQLSHGKVGNTKGTIGKKTVVRVGLGAIAWLMLIAAPLQALEQTPLPVVLEPIQPCEFWPEPQQFNTQRRRDTIVIGQQRNRRYQVIIPGGDATTLRTLRTCVSDAFASRVRWGRYLQIGSFASRSEAEAIRKALQKEGYHPRVIYSR